MVDVEAMRSELESLLKELAKRGTVAVTPQVALAETTESAGDGDAEDYAGALQKLSHYIAEAADDAGEKLAAHPLAAIGAAFMLGVAVGRMSRR